jgi:Ca2+-binding RTX toxin-like protein
MGGDDTLTGGTRADKLDGGEGDDTLSGGGGIDVLAGGAGADTLDGGDGDDTLDGGAGADMLGGGAGVDTASYQSSTTGVQVDLNVAGPQTSTGGADGDRLSSIENVAGSTFDDTLTGDAQSNALSGNGGNDTLIGGPGGDTMKGGAGDDTYLVDASDIVTELAGQGTDTVQASTNYILSANVENLTLLGGNDTDGWGNELANTLLGNSGNNALDGGGGADSMKGGAGNDTYVVDNAGDVVTELAGQGIDTVQARVSYVLSDNVETLALLGVGDTYGVGNALANTLLGNSGNNILDGKAGADSMKGGAGNDTYMIDNVGDVITELAGQGTDTVRVLFSYTLGTNLENLTLLGTGNVNGAGNALSNTLQGNSGNNILNGQVGADTMKGGAGNDTYAVDNAGDVVTELTGGGSDTVQTGVSYTLANNIENLTLTGAANINGTGNGLTNTLRGNDGVNGLSGGDGNDTLLGGLGNDTLVGGLGRDVMTGGAGADRFDFNSVNESGPAITTRDLIVYFVQGSDKIDLSTIDANATLVGNQAFAFIGAAVFHGIAGELRQSPFGATTLVSGDINGDAVADFQIQLNGAHALTAGNFTL